MNNNKYTSENKMNQNNKQNNNKQKRTNKGNKYITINNNYINSDSNQNKNIKNKFTPSIPDESDLPPLINPYVSFTDKNNIDKHEHIENNLIDHIKMIHIFKPSTISSPKPSDDNIKSNDNIKEENINKLEKDYEEIIISDEIKNITDLILLSKKYSIDENKEYSIDLKKLNKIIPYLEELNNMIGMEDIKKSLADQLMYFLQGFEYKHALHTIIEGPPGVGKTCLGKILGNIYLNLECIKNDEPEALEESDDGPMNMSKLFNSIIMR